MRVIKNPPANTRDARDKSSVPGSGRSPGVGNDIPLQYSCLENSIGRGAWWATVHGATKSQTQILLPSLFLPQLLVLLPVCAQLLTCV